MNRRGEPGCCLTFVLAAIIGAGLAALGFRENVAYGAGILVAIIGVPITIAFTRARSERQAMTPTMIQAPATRGWHQDPTGRHPFRYWDGTAWTDAVSDGSHNGVDPVGPT